MSDVLDDFFIGHLPTPPLLRRILVIVAITCVAVAVLTSSMIAITQRDPGTGKWNSDPDVTNGVIIEHPYPMLRTPSRSFVLVSEGKLGAAGRVAGMNGKNAKVRGTTIEHNGFCLIEILDVEPTGDNSTQPMVNLWSETSALRGEIIDTKCHSGAMKPGDGKAHKACAALCLRGGIPPAFLDDSGNRYLLLDDTGAGIRGASLDAILPFVGDRVELHGLVSIQDDLKFLRTDVHQIQRLTP